MLRFLFYSILILFILLSAIYDPGLITNKEVKVGIVHDYVFLAGTKECDKHSGLHYVVTKTDINDYNNHDYPCKNTIKFRCQDGTLLNFDDGISYCFIQEYQIKESL